METIILELLDKLRCNKTVSEKTLAQVLHAHNKGIAQEEQRFSKRRLLPYYLKVRDTDPQRWQSWDIDDALEKRLMQLLQMKPRRTASGVATITVITKPNACSSNCLYCPCDVRMPKSYLASEPACQRAERNCFDPYLQVASRLRALVQMGHHTSKIELIVLGGTWSDYSRGYQLWFVSELFRALNEASNPVLQEHSVEVRRKQYRAAGVESRAEHLAHTVEETQRQVYSGERTFNEAIASLYGAGTPWAQIACWQEGVLGELEREQLENETASHRVVGLVVETRPDTLDCASLTMLRQLGCTKIQMGIQSLDPDILAANHRNVDPTRIARVFELLRIFGFKIHVHFMVNLFGSTSAADVRDYERLVSERPFQPDEVKLYPCVLTQGTGLAEKFARGSWQPYDEEELVRVLVADVLATPSFTRISRMIRDIQTPDIIAGNKKTNLRQMVEVQVEKTGLPVAEIRSREIATSEVSLSELSFETVCYTTSNTRERFLQWVTGEGRIAGFLRLSLPDAAYVGADVCDSEGSCGDAKSSRDAGSVGGHGRLPVGAGEAMIREVHVYGKAANLSETGEGVQHAGLGKQLVEAACDIAREEGYTSINVISSVGTREYYRALGFTDGVLYQQRSLIETR